MIIGIIGNGQLGRMLSVAAKKMGHVVYVYGPGISSPAGQVSDKEYNGSYDDMSLLQSFAKDCDVITFEFENICVTTLHSLQKTTPVYPAPDILAITQDRLSEKSWLRGHSFPTADFVDVRSQEDISMCIQKFQKAILKTRRFGYDGKGQVKIDRSTDVEALYQEYANTPCIIEKMVGFDKEVSVIVARNINGETQCFPVFENVHKDHILYTTYFPARVESSIAKNARDIALRMADEIGLIGLLTIEMFVLPTGEILINELAPRPHNSGHVTIEASYTSQFEQHIRAITGMPLGVTDIREEGTMMNILGDNWREKSQKFPKILDIPKTYLHLYGKDQAKDKRKMGHITLLGGDREQNITFAQSFFM